MSSFDFHSPSKPLFVMILYYKYFYILQLIHLFLHIFKFDLQFDQPRTNAFKLIFTLWLIDSLITTISLPALLLIFEALICRI